MTKSKISAAVLALSMTVSLSTSMVALAPTTAHAVGPSLVGQRLTTAGIGQLKIGMTVAQARKLGYVTGSGNCIHVTARANGGAMDVEIGGSPRVPLITGIEVYGSKVLTKSGAHVGTPYSQLRKLLGSKLKKASYSYEGGYLYGYRVDDGTRHMFFQFRSANPRVADKVTNIDVFSGSRPGAVAEC